MSLTKFAITAYLFLLAVSGAIVLWPEPPARPLVEQGAWQVQGAWSRPVRFRPNEIEARRSILSSPATVVHMSYSPDKGVTQGQVESASFEAPRFIAIAFNGEPYDPEEKIDFYLECLESHSRQSVARANTNTQWSEAVFAVEDDWCKSEVSLVASSDSQQRHLAFAAPFAVSRLSYLKSRGIGQIFIHFTIFLFLFQVGLVGVLIWGKLKLPGADFTIQIMTIGILGYGAFFLMDLSSKAGSIFAWSLILGSPIIIAAFLTFNPSFLTEKLERLKWTTFAWFVGSLGFTLLLYSIDNGGGSWSTNYRFTPANWSSDNQLSLFISQNLANGMDIGNLKFGPWLVSDRPQLLTGVVCLVRPLLLFIYGNNDGPYLYHHGYHMVGITMMSLWLPASLFLLSRAGLSSRRSQLFILLIIALSPFSILNSLYISPKMLSGAFGIMAFCYLLIPLQREGERESTRHHRWLHHGLMAASVLSVLSLMSHGGGFFAIIVMGVLGFFRYFSNQIRSVIMAGVLGLLLLMPWILWQKIAQPPGNALVKYAFAGTYGFEEQDKGLFETIWCSYSNAELVGWLELRGQALLALFGAGDAAQATRISVAKERSEDVMDMLRWRDQYFLFPAMMFFTLIGAGALGLKRRALNLGKESLELTKVSCRMVGVALISFGLTICLIWKDHLFFHFPYPAHLLLLLGSLSILQALEKKRISVVIGVTVGLYSVLVYVVDPVVDALRVDTLSLVLFLCILLISVARLFYWDQQTKKQSSDQKPC